MLSILFGILIALTTTTVLLMGFFESIKRHGIHIVTITFLVAFALAVYEKWREISSKIFHGDSKYSFRMQYDEFLSVFFGAIITYYINNSLGMGPVIAAGVVGLTASLILPRYELAVYCGSALGMVSDQVLSLDVFFFASMISAITYLYVKFIFNGVGGKLGTIALFGSILVVIMTERDFAQANLPIWEAELYLVVSAVLGATLTYTLHTRFCNSPVRSSSIVGLTAGLVMPRLIPDLGYLLSVIVICASFAGMSSKEKIPHEGYMAAVGALCGLMFIYSAPYFNGAGGKLGVIAFNSVVIVVSAKEIFRNKAKRT